MGVVGESTSDTPCCHQPGVRVSLSRLRAEAVQRWSSYGRFAGRVTARPNTPAVQGGVYPPWQIVRPWSDSLHGREPRCYLGEVASVAGQCPSASLPRGTTTVSSPAPA